LFSPGDSDKHEPYDLTSVTENCAMWQKRKELLLVNRRWRNVIQHLSLKNLNSMEQIWWENWTEFASDQVESFFSCNSLASNKKLNFLAFKWYVTLHIWIWSALSTLSTKIGHNMKTMLAGKSIKWKLGCRCFSMGCLSCNEQICKKWWA
jgi:hypothetical protein